MDADSSDEEDEDFDVGGAEAAQQAADEAASDPDTSDEEGLEVFSLSVVPLSEWATVSRRVQSLLCSVHSKL